MASGTTGLSDTRSDKNVVAQIAQLSWEKVKSAEKMAGAEKKYAKKKLGVGEEGGLTQEEFSQRYGRGSFFRKALGSEFGGDKIARNRGRVESFFDKDVPAGRDPTKSKRGRYREGFEYPEVEPKSPMVGNKPKTERKAEEGEKKSSRSSRTAINEAMASALAGIEIQLTKLSEKFTSTVSVPEGLIEVINKQSQIITTGFDGLSKALYTLLGSIQKQTATMVRLDQEQKNLDAKNLDRQQALDEENALEEGSASAGNAAVTGFEKIGGKGGGGGLFGRMFGASALARKIGRRGAARAGTRAAAAVGGKGAAKFMGKATGKAFAKAGLKSGLKKIPLLGLGVGAFFAAQRAMKGDILGAGLELASGAASMIPGAGTVASLGVDGVLAARDAGIVPFAKGGMVTKPMFGVVGEGKDPEMITPWNKKTFEMMNKARLDAIMKNRNKFADVQATGLEEYYENRGGWKRFGEILMSLFGGSGTPPGPNPDIDIDYSNLESGDISSTAGKVATLYDEFRDLGYTEEASKRIIAEVGREGSMSNKNLFGTHTDPKAGISNTGMFSWNDTRRDALISAAKKAGVWDESKGQLKETAEALRFQARFADYEIKQMGAGIHEALTTQGTSGAKISQLLRDKVIRYDASYAGGVDAEYGSNRTEDWWKTLKLDTNLEQTRTTSDRTEPPQEPISKIPEENQLGQAIKQNFGMDTNDSRFFDVPGYGKIEAYKTTKGFDFFKDRTKLSMHPSRPQAKAIYEYFIKTNGGQKLDGNEQSSRLLSESQNYSTRKATSGPNVQVSVINGGGSDAAVPKENNAPPGLGRKDLSPAFAEVNIG